MWFVFAFAASIAAFFVLESFDEQDDKSDRSDDLGDESDDFYSGFNFDEFEDFEDHQSEIAPEKEAYDHGAFDANELISADENNDEIQDNKEDALEVYNEEINSYDDFKGIVEDFVHLSLPDFFEEADLFFWHEVPQNIDEFDLSQLTISLDVLYPEIAEIFYNETLLAHVEREAYGL